MKVISCIVIIRCNGPIHVSETAYFASPCPETRAIKYACDHTRAEQSPPTFKHEDKKVWKRVTFI